MTTVWIVHSTDPYEYASGWVEGVYTNEAAAKEHVTRRGFGEIKVEHWQVHDAYNPDNLTWSLD